jgi:hypothetical protein
MGPTGFNLYSPHRLLGVAEGGLAVPVERHFAGDDKLPRA